MSGQTAYLVLADGLTLRGERLGASGHTVGEAVFTTGMTGYHEVLTDPSYRGQIVTMTAPEIGNVGVNPVDFESNRPWCAGFVVRELSPLVSNWRASGSLHSLLADHGVAGISGIDTRAVTRRIRLSGAQRAVIDEEPRGPARQFREPLRGVVQPRRSHRGRQNQGQRHEEQCGARWF